MSKLVQVLSVLLVLAMLAGCTMVGGAVVTGSGRAVTSNYDLAGFTKVSVGSAFEVTVDRGDQYVVSVTTDDNLKEYLDVHVNGDTLSIGFKPLTSLGLRNTTLKAQITMPDLTGINFSGATRGQVSGFSNDKTVDVEVSGASQLHGDFTTGEMRMQASGASTVEITGSTGNLNADASGASSLRLGNYASRDTRVQASGASNITVNASGQLSGEASGASSVRYTGNPASVQVNTSGASNVRQQ